MITDMFGTELSRGDIFVYCPGSKRGASMNVGVFVDSHINHRDRPKAKVTFINDGHYESSETQIDADTFSSRTMLISNPYFYIGDSAGSKLVEAAILVAEGMGRDERPNSLSGSQDQIPE